MPARLSLLATAFASLFVSLTAAWAAPGDAPQPAKQVAQQAPRPSTKAQPNAPITYGSQQDSRIRERVNAGTLGLAAGQLEGAPLRFATELARVLDDGDRLRVLPIVTRGIFDNLLDLVYLKGIDAAIVYGDVLEHFKKDAQLSGLTRRVSYIASLFPSEFHLFVRPEINSIADLAGKRVNFNTQGTAAAYSGPILFDRLGVKVEPTFDPHPVAIEEMLKGDKYAAVLFVSSKPLAPFQRPKWPPGFKFIDIPYSDALEYYTPAWLETSDYPALIPQGQRIATVSVPAVLAVYDWAPDSDRYRRLALLVERLFVRLEKLQSEAGYHPKWKDLNLAAKVPGWQRFRPMQERLEQTADARTAGIDEAIARAEAEKAAPGNPEEQQRLFRQFIEWRKRQIRQQ